MLLDWAGSDLHFVVIWWKGSCRTVSLRKNFADRLETRNFPESYISAANERGHGQLDVRYCDLSYLFRRPFLRTYVINAISFSPPLNHEIRSTDLPATRCDVRRIKNVPLGKNINFLSVSTGPVLSGSPFSPPVLISYLSDRTAESGRYCVDFNMLWTCFVNCLFKCLSFIQKEFGSIRVRFSIEISKKSCV